MPATLSRAHRRFLVVDEVISSSVVNFLLNAGIAWFLFRGTTTVPLWGSASIGVDTLVTAFVLPLLTALIATPLVRVLVANGKLPPLPRDARGSAWWPRRSMATRGALLGIAAVVLVAVPVVVLFTYFGPSELSTARFIWFKGGFAAGVGALVTPLLGWWALVDASHR
jgi:hypothetical protein